MDIKERINRYLELRAKKEELEQQLIDLKSEIASEEELLINEMTLNGQRAITLFDGRKIVMYTQSYYSLNQNEKESLIDMVYSKSKTALSINPRTAIHFLEEEGRESQIETFVRITKMPRIKLLKA